MEMISGAEPWPLIDARSADRVVKLHAPLGAAQPLLIAKSWNRGQQIKLDGRPGIVLYDDASRFPGLRVLDDLHPRAARPGLQNQCH